MNLEKFVKIVRGNKVVATSLQVADVFGKRHGDVLRAIENLLSRCLKDGFGERNFAETSYVDSQNKIQKMYHLTRDGFTFLAMGFTGSKADDFKIDYINAFNSMEEFIRTKMSSEWQAARKDGKMIRRETTDSISEKLIPLAIEQGSKNYKMFYMNYSKLVNKVTGIENNMRDKATDKTLFYIAMLEDLITKTITDEAEKGTHYKDIYQICKEKCKQLSEISLPPKQKYISIED